MLYLTTGAQAARYLGITPRTVRRLIQKGDFPEPIQKTPCNYGRGGGFSRVWTSEQLDGIKEEIQEKQKHHPRK